MMVKTPEVLAPAGDFERLLAAVRFGADAVYLAGKKFGMRASPANFAPDELKMAVDYCRLNGVKVYLTMNALPLNSEIEELPEFIDMAAQSGVDAIIAADIGVLRLIKRRAPDMHVHISTQAGVVNYLAATELYNLGASRVILARELSLDEIIEIRGKTPTELEIETFVHGAMCVSFSGRCLFSQYLVGRDANRGECAQPCRWGYHLMEEKRDGLYFPVFEDEKGSYILNAQDLCMIEHIDKLAKAGVSSIKIEGRAKSEYYVAAVTNAYRFAADLYAQNPENYAAPDWLLDEVRKVSHREYSTGFYFPGQPAAQCYESGGYVREWEVVATVEGWEDGFLLCTERNRFSAGERLEILIPRQKPDDFIPAEMLDEENQPVETARHPMMRFKIKCEKPYPKGCMLRRETKTGN